jgi:Transglycosylase SLT domain
MRARVRTALHRAAHAGLVGLVGVLALGAIGAGAASAREVTLPLELDFELLRQALIAQVFVDRDQTARVWDDGSGCNELVLSDPVVGERDGTVRIESRGAGRAGFALLSFCLFPFEWEGFVEVLEEPELVAGTQVVRFRVVDSNLYGRERKKQFATGLVWDWVKEYAQPRFAELHVDLGAPVREVAELLPLFLPGSDAARARRVLESVTLAGVAATDRGLRVSVRLELDDQPIATAAPPEPGSSPTAEADATAPAGAPAGAPAPDEEPPLSEAELVAFAVALQQVDAFMTFVVKQAGSETPLAVLHAALVEVLLEERFDLIDALASPRRDPRDPVRQIFLETWVRLAPVLRRLAPTLPTPLAVRTLSFVSAGDALRALDELGPATGLEISADGLRRLARIIAPTAPGDPLAYDLGVDPELRALAGFGAPLPPPEDAEDGDEDADANEPDDTPTIDKTPEPTLAPAARLPAPRSTWLGLGTAAALAVAALADASPAEASPVDGDGGIDDEVIRRLNRWAPTGDDLEEYLPLVRDLLQAVAVERVREDRLSDEIATLFRALVPATAWQESCWRQFVRRGGDLAPLRSPVGAVGIMQVNQSVWRGFYEPRGLQRDMRYNARAGAEILARYLRNHVIGKARYEDRGDDLVSAAYAAYNGGPGQLRRFEKGRASRRERAVYASFRGKLAQIRSGDALAVRACFAG